MLKPDALHPSKNDPLKALSLYRSSLMGLSALMVLFFHCWIPLVPNHRFLGATESAVKNIGWVGASSFFLLSGMGLAYSDLGRGIRGFYLRRLKRLVFPYLFVAVVRTVSEKWTIPVFLSNFFGLSFFTKSIYALLWFVPAITVLYLFFPAYNRLLNSGRLSVFAVTMAAIFIWLLLSVLLRDVLRSDLWGFTNRIPLFLLGVFFGKTAQQKEIRSSPVWGAFALASAVAGYFLLVLTQKGMFLLVPDSPSALPAGLFSVGTLFLVSQFLSFTGSTAIGKALTSLLSFFGKLSLELYCIQEWLWGRLYMLLEGHVSYTAINLLSFIVLPASACLLYLLERSLFQWLFSLTSMLKHRLSTGKP